MDLLTYVDIETARAARGLRMVVASALPSPWSEAAKGLFRVKQIPALAVRSLRVTPDVKAWTGADSVPVVLLDDEQPLTGWAGGSPSSPPIRRRARACSSSSTSWRAKGASPGRTAC